MGTESTTSSLSREEMLRRMVRFKDMTPRPKPGAGVVPQEIVDFLTATENYSYLAPAMEGQSVIQRYAARRR